ncbi:MAG: SIR2 family protein [Nitrospirae bacterium]|nr:SIR2 family protein [Magnetococcales bacterium]
MPVDMNLSGYWQYPDNVIQYLGNQLYEGRLAIILGAGLSAGVGLPDWKTLVENMLQSGNTVLNTVEPMEAQIERFGLTHFKNDPPGFLNLVHQYLYSKKGRLVDIGFGRLSRQPLLRAIGALVMASSRGHANQIITLNFDNILETYLQYYGVTVNTVFRPNQWVGRHDVTVLHPHGFLPQNSKQPRSNELIFDQTSFLKAIGNPDHPWNQRIQSIIRTHTCLWIGLSGNDLHLQHWALNAKDHHAAREDDSAQYHVVWFTTDQTKKDDPLYTDGKRIFPFIVADWQNDLPKRLLEICQYAAQLRHAIP